MKRILLPGQQRRALPFYLALEEYAARTLPADDYFFSWIVAPTVIVGRNQDLAAEVDLDYCQSHGIDVVRRRSGGGCVFADLNNIMLSYITPSVEVQTTFAAFTRRVAAQLCAMGIDARAGGRNDILVADRKISGNAFYHLPGRSIVHGTMLYRTDMDMMSHAITPARAKLLSHGVQSVPSRIVTASELLPGVSLQEFHARLVDGLADDTLTLTAADIAAVEALERQYRHPEWLHGRRRTAHAQPVRIDGCGTVRCHVELDGNGLIAAMEMTGDFFALDSLDTALVQPLIGVKPQRQAIMDAVPQPPIAGLSADSLADIITYSTTKH